MSEEIKDIILDVKDSLNETPKNMYKYNKITLNLNEFEEILNYIEQLEKENEKLKYLVDDSNIMKAFIVEHNKVEQLENIIKEAIKLLKKCGIVDEKGNFNACLDTIELKDLLNILNKGDNNGK